MTMRSGEWIPVSDAAPINEVVIVTSQTNWTLARRCWVSGIAMQLGWPFFAKVGHWEWVYSFALHRPIDFTPTHYQRVVIDPPPIGGHLPLGRQRPLERSRSVLIRSGQWMS